MKLIFASLFTLIAFNFGYSQSQELEDISLEMLRETQSPSDSSAVAEVLYEKGKISFSILNVWEYQFEVIRRIKIYSQEGYEQANIKIQYYVGNKNADKEFVSNIDGYVYYEENGKIEREKLRNQDIFDVDLSEMWEAKKFTLPKIQDGVIIEYSYTIDSPHISNLPKWVFQNTIPTRYSEFITRIPNEYLAYSVRTAGYYPIGTSSDVEQSSLSGFQGRTTIKETKHIGTNLPKIEEESFVNNVSNYLPSTGYELSSYKTGKNEAYKSVSRTWNDVAETLSETDTYKKEISRSNYFEDDLDALLKGKTLPTDKMNTIFNFVKDKMTWNDEEKRYTSNRLDKVYEEGIGNSADINVMLVAMLRRANLDANPVLCSTISNGISIFPTISGFNYVIVHVNINAEIYLLDATDEFTSPNILPKRTLNGKGTIIKSNGFESLDLTPSFRSSKKFQIQAELTSEGEVNGMCRIISLDQYGLESRQSLNNKSTDELKLKYESAYNINKIEEITNSNLKDTSKPFLEGFTFSGKEQFIEKIGDKLYLSPMMFLKLKENPFKEEERVYPVDFTFPRNIEHFISIKIPKDYQVDYLPEKVIFKLGGGGAQLTYLIEEYNKVITVKVNQEINESLFLPQDYSLLREFYISLMNKENEKIILVKS
jgi:transglutaminase-like putative cysteine protease